MGSWPFIGALVAAMLLWAVLNSGVLAHGAWDPYLYILLNLFLSMLAGLQGAILLLAAKQQDAIAAAMAQNDYDTNVAAKVEIEWQITLCERQTRMLSELQPLVLSMQAGRPR